eukprot:EC122268.1.p1 GENE.EC122268.1~~EC122268.1.p1  ORF type:complete len:123 (+),score=6.25 EC122268.1:123-491(+)
MLRAVLSRHSCLSAAALPIRGGGVTIIPPFKPPTGPLPEEADLVWQDGATEEACLDDYTYLGVGKFQSLFMTLGMIGLLTGLYQLGKSTDPAGSRPTVVRGKAHVAGNGLYLEYGGDPEKLE